MTGNTPKPKKEPFVPGPYQILWNTNGIDFGTEKKAFLFDVDGTLAKKGDRGYYDWQRVDVDHPIDDVIEMSQILRRAGYAIVVVSGRDGACGQLTFDWLNKQGVPFCALVTRQARDQRKDSIIKTEIYNECIVPRWDVQGVFDDRNQVVDTWRALGLRCYQVAPGDF